jgi:hypothetical protein
MSGFRKPGSSIDNTDALEPSVTSDALSERAEERLREHLKEEYDREPTEDEVEWVRAFPRRMAGGRPPEDPRIPTVTEMRKEFEWGPSNSLKERWGEDFTERKTSSPDLSNR